MRCEHTRRRLGSGHLHCCRVIDIFHLQLKKEIAWRDCVSPRSKRPRSARQESLHEAAHIHIYVYIYPRFLVYSRLEARESAELHRSPRVKPIQQARITRSACPTREYPLSPVPTAVPETSQITKCKSFIPLGRLAPFSQCRNHMLSTQEGTCPVRPFTVKVAGVPSHRRLVNVGDKGGCIFLNSIEGALSRTNADMLRIGYLNHRWRDGALPPRGVGTSVWETRPDQTR